MSIKTLMVVVRVCATCPKMPAVHLVLKIPIMYTNTNTYLYLKKLKFARETDRIRWGRPSPVRKASHAWGPDPTWNALFIFIFKFRCRQRLVFLFMLLTAKHKGRGLGSKHHLSFYGLIVGHSVGFKPCYKTLRWNTLYLFGTMAQYSDMSASLHILQVPLNSSLPAVTMVKTQ